jgi:hypothetical protein
VREGSGGDGRGREMVKNNWKRIKLRNIEKKKELMKKRRKMLEKEIEIDDDLMQQKKDGS